MRRFWLLVSFYSNCEIESIHVGNGCDLLDSGRNLPSRSCVGGTLIAVLVSNRTLSGGAPLKGPSVISPAKSSPLVSFSEAKVHPLDLIVVSPSTDVIPRPIRMMIMENTRPWCALFSALRMKLK